MQNPTGKVAGISIALHVKGASAPAAKTALFNLGPGENLLTMDYPMGSNAKLWNEFHPSLYQFQAVLTDLSSKRSDTLKTSFGMREFKAVGKQILINGQPTFLRGTLECAIFPKTGYPPTTTVEWQRIFKICRAPWAQSHALPLVVPA